MALSRLFNDSFFRSPSIFSNEFHNVFNEFDRIMTSQPFAESSLTTGSFSPRVKLSEEQNNYKIEAEVAGFPKDALSLEFPDPQVLRISGKFEQETKHEPDTTHEATQNGKDSKKDNKDPGTAVVTARSENDKQLSHSKGARVWHNERISKSFTRNIGLPSPVDTENVKASLENGILSIVVPKLNKPDYHKKIEIIDAKI